jgi:hypothetical protein
MDDGLRNILDEIQIKIANSIDEGFRSANARMDAIDIKVDAQCTTVGVIDARSLSNTANINELLMTVQRIESNSRENVNAINVNSNHIAILDANVHVLRRGDEEKVRRKLSKNILIHGISEVQNENHHDVGLRHLVSLGFTARDQLEVNTIRQGHPYPGRTTIRPLRMTFSLLTDKINFRRDFIYTQHPDLQRLKSAPYLTDHLTPLQQHEFKTPENKGSGASAGITPMGASTNPPAGPSALSQAVDNTDAPNAGTGTNLPTTSRRGRPPGGLKRAADSQAGAPDCLVMDTGLLPAKKLKSQKFIGRKKTVKKVVDSVTSNQVHQPVAEKK